MLPHLDDFLLYLKTNNYSLETVYNYERDLGVLSRFLDESSTPFERLDKREVAEFKAYLASKDRQTPIKGQTGPELASRSLNRMLSSLRSFLRYLIDMDLPCPLSPEAIKMVKTEKRHAQVAEFPDLIKLIESPAYLENDSVIALRNQAILEVLFSTGMRISEICKLNRSHIDGSGRIFIMGKGKKERFVYLTPRAQAILDRYSATRQDDLPALFVPYAGPNVSSAKKKAFNQLYPDEN